MAKNKEPELPKLPKKKKQKFYRVETDYIIADFYSKKIYQQCLAYCETIGVNFDHYMLEFNTSDNNFVK